MVKRTKYTPKNGSEPTLLVESGVSVVQSAIGHYRELILLYFLFMKKLTKGK